MAIIDAGTRPEGVSIYRQPEYDILKIHWMGVEVSVPFNVMSSTGEVEVDWPELHRAIFHLLKSVHLSSTATLAEVYRTPSPPETLEPLPFGIPPLE